MSPVFRHGRLRLYLLRLLDEEPRHGYEVIRLLRDRFMGIYSPSPGTIYPRLARLEEEGLVTHDEKNGRKVYRITEAGREELRERSTDLRELEAELAASVNDIVREVREDVRDTVRTLREELTWAAREMRRGDRESRDEAKDEAGSGDWTAWLGRKGHRGPHDLAAFRDLEHLAREFASDLRKVALESEALGGEALSSLRDILEEALERVKTEVFTRRGHAP